jgi:SAM-dependent methyltransferase
MRLDDLHLLVCPDCRTDLTLSDPAIQNDRIESGLLQCSTCQAEYPIVRYIPRFVPLENYASSFGLQWIKHARTQYDSHSQTRISEERFFNETRWPGDLTGQTILEAGSGSGRFTEQAISTGATVVSLDYSYAVEANYASNGHSANILIVQGDIYRMPLRERFFDKVLCIGVIQHTPDVEKAFKSLPRHLRDGGQLVIDVYPKRAGLLGWLNHARKTRYWVRPFTRKMSPERLYNLVKRYINFMWPLTRLLDRIPVIGNKINWFLLIADYRGRYPLSEEQLKEWAILDTFDILSPAYDQPQTIETVRQWFAECGMVETEIHYGYNGIEARGIKPATTEAAPADLETRV